MPESDTIDWGENFTRLTEKDLALAHMNRIAAKLTQLESEQKELRLEYWRHQAAAYPTTECQHGSTHFCCHCTGGNNE